MPQKIETLLGVKAFEIQGRKAMLTPTGQMLYRRALALVNEANELEQAAHQLSAGWEATITIAVEILFPSGRLLACLDRFGQESPSTRIELIESVLGGTADALLSGQVDLAISPQVPPGFLGGVLTQVRLLAVAHADHPLHHQPQALTYRDLRNYRHIVVRDSGNKRDQRAVTIIPGLLTVEIVPNLFLAEVRAVFNQDNCLDTNSLCFSVTDIAGIEESEIDLSFFNMPTHVRHCDKYHQRSIDEAFNFPFLVSEDTGLPFLLACDFLFERYQNNKPGQEVPTTATIRAQAHHLAHMFNFFYKHRDDFDYLNFKFPLESDRPAYKYWQFLRTEIRDGNLTRTNCCSFGSMSSDD